MTGGDRQWTAQFFHAFIQSTLIGGELHVATNELDPEDIIGVALWCVCQWFTFKNSEDAYLCVYRSTGMVLATNPWARKSALQEIRPQHSGSSRLSQEQRDAGYIQLMGNLPEHLSKWLMGHVNRFSSAPRSLTSRSHR